MFAVPLWTGGCGSAHGDTAADKPAAAAAAAKDAAPTVDLSATQLEAIKIEPAGTYMFPVENETVGNIDFDEDLSVQVFPQYPGTIIETFAEVGNDVKKDQPLYTIKSPDLIQAESDPDRRRRNLRAHRQGTGASQKPEWDRRSFRPRIRAGDLGRTNRGRRP